MATAKKAEFEIAHHHYTDDEMPARRVTVVQEDHGISLHIEGCGQKTMETGTRT